MYFCGAERHGGDVVPLKKALYVFSENSHAEDTSWFVKLMIYRFMPYRNKV